MSATRERLQEIFNDADEADGRWGPKMSLLASWVSDLAATVAALDEGQERNEAEIGALRIQTLLPPHIAEASDARMDELEALMTQEDEQVRSDLAGLGALPKLSGDADLATAMARYDQFREIKSQILALSRENTNVRSLSISLNQKRKVMFSCQEALRHLEDDILEEPIEGVTYGRPAKPR